MAPLLGQRGQIGLHIFSRADIAAIEELSFRYVIISITEPTSPFTDFPIDDGNLLGLLAMKFSDVTEELDLEVEGSSYNLRSITDNQARLMLDFAKLYKDEVDSIIINCDAGISRSSAVAAALSYIFNGSDSHIWDNPRYFPNKMVYDTILKAAGYSNDYSCYYSDEQRRIEAEEYSELF